MKLSLLTETASERHLGYHLRHLLEAIAFQGNVTRNTEQVLKLLQVHLGKQASDMSPRSIVDVIRHNFTNYDQEWRALERTQLDPCDKVTKFNKLRRDTHALVKRFVTTYLASQGPLLLAANDEWLRGKLQPVPKSCEEDDPLAWRAARSSLVRR